ncbi:MAG: hypothetical protein DELT_01387 [Desulfovibrio sp.]
MSCKVFLSVIVPVYNAMPYLHDCLDSLAGQVGEGCEIILVDDGSSDGSGALCDAYAAARPFTRVLRTERLGPAGARRTGMGAATGCYIGFVDADDVIESDMFAELCAHLRRQKDGPSGQPDMAVCAYSIGSEGAERFRGMPLRPGLHAGREYEDVILLNLFCDLARTTFSPFCTQWNAVVEAGLARREAARLPEKLVLGEDTAFIMGCLLGGKCVYYSDKALYHHRERSGSQSNAGWDEKPDLLLEQREILHQHLMRLTAEHPFCDLFGQLQSYVLFIALLDLRRYGTRPGFADQYLASPHLRDLLRRELQAPLPSTWLEALRALEVRG